MRKHTLIRKSPSNTVTNNKHTHVETLVALYIAEIIKRFSYAEIIDGLLGAQSDGVVIDGIVFSKRLSIQWRVLLRQQLFDRTIYFCRTWITWETRNRDPWCGVLRDDSVLHTLEPIIRDNLDMCTCHYFGK
jgi:hypothetical protein